LLIAVGASAVDISPIISWDRPRPLTTLLATLSHGNPPDYLRYLANVLSSSLCIANLRRANNSFKNRTISEIKFNSSYSRMKEHGDRDLNMFKKLRDLRCTVNMKFHLLNAKAPAEIYCAKRLRELWRYITAQARDGRIHKRLYSLYYTWEEDLARK
jgi:hypothetical protein